jgi:hypothetical protein
VAFDLRTPVQYQPSPQDFQLRRRRPRSTWRRTAAAWSLLFAGVLAFALFASHPRQAGAIGASRSGVLPVVQQVVQQQLQALATQDALQAFALADTDMRTQFGSAEAFLTTVREQYPMLMHPASVLFLKPETDGSVAMQKVRLTDDEGSSWSLTYLLNRQTDNQWRISGCVVTPEGKQVLT